MLKEIANRKYISSTQSTINANKKGTRNLKRSTSTKITPISYSKGNKRRLSLNSSLSSLLNSTKESSYKTKEKENFVLTSCVSSVNDLNTSYKPKSICKNSSFAKTQKKKMNLSMDYKDYYDNDEDLLHKLGSRFEEIKTKGINRYKDNIIEKNNRKYELEKSIESLQKQIRMYKSKKNYWIKENAKVVNDINMIQRASQRYEENNIDDEKENNNGLIGESMLRDIKKENVRYQKEIIKEKSEMMLLQSQIQRYNKKIIDIKKEKDLIQSKLKFFCNHSREIRAKLSSVSNKTRAIEYSFNTICNHSYYK